MNCNKNGRNDGQSRVPSHSFLLLFIKIDEQHIINLLKIINDASPLQSLNILDLSTSSGQKTSFAFWS